jgi:hypothetical protein
MSDIKLEMIKKDILAVYGDFMCPDYSKIQRIYDESPYSLVTEELSTIFNVEENTDLNYDVSIGLTLCCGDEELALQLSLIGQYAVLIVSSVDGNGNMVIDSGTERKRNSEIKVLEILTRFNFDVLPSSLLSRKISFSRALSQSRDSSLYQILFSDEDILPWDV